MTAPRQASHAELDDRAGHDRYGPGKPLDGGARVTCDVPGVIAPQPAGPRSGVNSMQRRPARGTAHLWAWVMVLSVMLILLSVTIVAYSRWTEWQHQAARPPAPPAELLPERLPIPSSVPPDPKP